MRRFSEVQHWSLYLAKKFGFIPRAVVWDLLAPKGRTARYAYWREFQKSPLFSPYRIGSSSPEYLILSPKGKALMGADAVTEADNVYLLHDEIVMRFCLLLIQKLSVEKVWSEGELKKDRALALKSLGDGDISKLPDLIFDIEMSSANIRFALEIERTRKSRGRYQSMRRAYERALYVDGILFGVADDSIEDAIQYEIKDGGLEFFNKEVGFFFIDDFLRNNLAAKLRLRDKETTVGDYFRGLISDREKLAENPRHGVRGFLREISEAS